MSPSKTPVVLFSERNREEWESMPYCERHLVAGIEVPTNRRLAGWPICDDCFNGVPITLASIQATLKEGGHVPDPWAGRHST
jgi:hypothetical protein